MTGTGTDVWIGTYPEAGAGTPAGRGEGIWRVSLDPRSRLITAAHLAARTPAPSFLAVHPSGRVIYAVGETAPGTVTAFAVERPSRTRTPSLRPLGTVASGGDDPCHLALTADARTLLVANYSSGTLAVLPLATDGTFAPGVVASGGPSQVFAAEDSGSAGPGPDADRQDGPHAHFVAIAPGGRHVLVADLGTDELRRFRVDDAGGLVADGMAATLPPGTGPRHVAIGPGGYLYVAGELDASIHVLRWDPTTASALLVQSLPSCEAAGGISPTGHHLPSHVVLVGDVLYVAVRGADVVASFSVLDGGARIVPRDELATQGRWPRHLAVVDGLVVVAGQESGELELILTTPAGVLERGGTTPLPAPACVVPVLAAG